MKLSRTVLTVIALLSLVVAACGGAGTPPPGDDPSPTSTSTAPPGEPPRPTTPSTIAPPPPPPPTTSTPVPDEPDPQPPTISWHPPVVLEEGPDGVHGEAARGRAGILAVAFSPTDLDATTRVLRSADGRDWHEEALLAEVRLFSIAAGGPGYVAVGERQVGGSEETGSFEVEPAIFVSSDGVDWTEAAIAGAAPAAATVTRAERLGLADPGTVIAALATADGPDVSGGSIRDVAVTPSGLLAVGTSPLGHRAVWTSGDGLAWIERPGDPFGESDAGVVAVAAGRTGLLALGRVPTVGDYPGAALLWHSPDGSTWEDVAYVVDGFGQGPFVGGIVAFGDGFAMAGSWLEEGPAAWISPDGRTWPDPVPLPTRPGASSFVHDLATDGTTLVAVGDDVLFGDGPADFGPSIWTSPDGSTWWQVPPADVRGDLSFDAAAPGLALAFDGRWLVYGQGWSYDDVPPRHLLWEGLPGGPRLVAVEVHFLADGSADCDDVAIATRQVAAPGVLRGALDALLAGPTADEIAAGMVSTFSAATAGMVNTVTIEDGVALIDFEDFSQIIPNASTSCGSAALYAQLDGTVQQFASVERAVYSFDGNVAAFYEWLQGSPPAGY